MGLEMTAGHVFLEDEAATLALGASLAGTGLASEIVFLHGDLGAGKTTLVRGFLRALGYGGAVKSPTYTLLETYELPRRLDPDASEGAPEPTPRSAGAVGGVRLRPRATPTADGTSLQPGSARGHPWDGTSRARSLRSQTRSAHAGLHVYHFDFYRIVDPRELGYMGIDELVSAPAVKLVEWPSHAGDRLPKPDIEVRLTGTGSHRCADVVDHR